jgi:DNA repair protein RAD51
MEALQAPQQELDAGAEQVDIPGPHGLQQLESAGVAAADIKKLQENGIHTVEGLAHAPMKQLTAIKGLTEVKIKKLKEAGACAACAARCARTRR